MDQKRKKNPNNNKKQINKEQKIKKLLKATKHKTDKVKKQDAKNQKHIKGVASKRDLSYITGWKSNTIPKKGSKRVSYKPLPVAFVIIICKLKMTLTAQMNEYKTVKSVETYASTYFRTLKETVEAQYQLELIWQSCF